MITARPLLFAGLVVPTLVTAAIHSQAETPRDLALTAVDANVEKAAKAQDTLRAMGPEGLNVLLQTHGWTLAGMRALDPDAAFTPEQQRLAVAVDRVARQKDAWMSGLYWHTSMEDALAEARATKKAVLSLQMLGNLDEDFSCANSRFFRTLLYSNPAVAAVMREHFVLAWTAVRPVPKITVELGDGRVLLNTVTGNSAHVVVSSDGSVVDVIPGLHSPKAFMQALEKAAAVEKSMRTAEEPARLHNIYHARQREHWTRAYELARQELGETAPPADWLDRQPLGGNRQARQLDGTTASVKRARFAMMAAISKARVEMPLAAPFFGGPDTAPGEGVWEMLGELDQRNVSFHDQSWRLILRKHRSPQMAAAPAASRRAMLEESLRGLVARDTVKNQLLFHRALHATLARGAPTLTAFVPELYRQFFLMPPEDPWMGLITTDTFVALDGSGAVDVPARR